MNAWIDVTLEELASKDPYAMATGPFGSAISAKHFVDNGVPVIRGSNLSLDVGTRLNEKGFAFLTPDKATEFKRSIAKRGDLIFTCWGTIGQVGLIDERSSFSRYVVSNKQMKLTLDPVVAHSEFVYYLLSGHAMTRAVQDQAIGSAVPGFNLGQLRRLRVRVPPAKVQRTIAAILASIDDLIENNLRQVEVLEKMAEAIYREWFIHFRYPGHEGVQMVDSALGPIPGGWDTRKLSDVAVITMGQSPPSEYYNSEGTGQPFHQGVTNFGKHFPTHHKYCSSDGRTAQAGDVLVSVRAPVGRLNIAWDEIVIGRGLAAVRSRQGHQGLLFRLLRHGVFVEEDAMGGGTIFKAISKQDLANALVLNPTPRLADQVDGQFTENIALIRNLTVSSQRLAAIRDLLLPKLVTGQIDVSDLDLEGLVGSVP